MKSRRVCTGVISGRRSFAPTLLSLVLLGGMWEEPGWTGFALPVLQARHGSRPFGFLRASLVMGLIRAGWHLPLMLVGAIPWFDVLFFSMAVQFLVSWLLAASACPRPAEETEYGPSHAISLNGPIVGWASRR